MGRGKTVPGRGKAVQGRSKAGVPERRRVEEEWRQDGVTGFATMYDDKKGRIMALAPQLMAYLIRIHQKGEFVSKYPPMIQKWIAELWAESAPENPLQQSMELWYGRCGCTPKDTADDSTSDLRNSSGASCGHRVPAKDIMDKLKGKTQQNGNSLYKDVKGRSRSDEPILEMLKHVRIGSPALRLVCKERHGQERNVFSGLVPLASAFPQQCMPAVPM